MEEGASSVTGATVTGESAATVTGAGSESVVET